MTKAAPPAIVLAAGESRRMGTQKLLLPFAGRTVIEHIVRQLRDGGINDIIVVTGADREAVEKRLARKKVRTVFNERYSEGMLSSVRAGLRAVPDDARSVLVALGDQPAICKHLVKILLLGFDMEPESILAPTYHGKRGHPVIIPMRYRDEILTRFDDVGLRGLMLRHRDAVRDIPVPTNDILRDMDYPEDYQRELDAHRDTLPPD